MPSSWAATSPDGDRGSKPSARKRRSMSANVSNTTTPLAVFSSQSSLGTCVPSLEIASIDEHPNCAKRRLLSAPKTTLRLPGTRQRASRQSRRAAPAGSTLPSGSPPATSPADPRSCRPKRSRPRRSPPLVVPAHPWLWCCSTSSPPTLRRERRRDAMKLPFFFFGFLWAPTRRYSRWRTVAGHPPPAATTATTQSP